MSRIRMLNALALCVVLAGALSLAAQVTDGAGVTVDLGGAALMHRTGVTYPQSAIASKAEGTVSVQATLDSTGNVSDARVLSGPDELRKTALTAVLQWHFARDVAGSTRVINITFKAPGSAAPMAAQSMTGVLGSMPASASTPNLTIDSIKVTGLPDTARDQLLATLGIHEGDAMSLDSMLKMSQAVRQFDEHLTVRSTQSANGRQAIEIMAPGAAGTPSSIASFTAPGATSASASGTPMNVAGNVQAAKAIPGSKVAPVYPPQARQAKIQGQVVLQAVIAPNGTMQEVKAISGHPMLIQAAIDAVKQWAYEPTVVNGQPVSVATQISVNFTLADGAPPPAQN